jgi:hypothetical protein
VLNGPEQADATTIFGASGNRSTMKSPADGVSS